MKLFTFTLIFIAFNLNAKTIKLKSDPWCPYNCGEKDKNQGIVVDIARAIFKKHNIDIEYSNVNYARALKDTRLGVVNGVVGCAKEDAPDFIFPNEALSEATYQYFALKDSHFSYKDTKSLVGKKVGAINSYTYDVETTNEIQKKNPSFVIVSGDQGLEQLVKMLNTKRVDAIVESGAVFSSYLQEKKIDSAKYKMVGTPKQEPQKIYVCFSPKDPNSKDYAKFIDEGMKELIKSGEYKKIVDKYNIKNWK
jgi:polar amino acid transport system substrate-binding protein